MFYVEDNVSIHIASPQMCNATFGIDLPVYDGDTPARMKTRMCRADKLIKGTV